ncbi:MAG: hypothetical protein QM784_20585 [Polyangiaceae bacterium]
MRTAILIAAGLLAACSPSYTQTAKTPDEMLEEQDAIAKEQEKKRQEHASYGDTAGDTTTDSEQAAKFDEHHTEMEISRAVRSAVTCPGVSGQGPYGDAKVTITFLTDGHVDAEKSTISEPFAGTANGDCVLRAMNAIITKNFVGQPVSKDVTVKLEQPAAAPAETKTKKK